MSNLGGTAELRAISSQNIMRMKWLFLLGGCTMLDIKKIRKDPEFATRGIKAE